MTKTATKKRKRKVGQGMKPRVPEANNAVLSADAGQQTPPAEPETGSEVRTQTGDTLEAEKVQNLESPVGVENPLSVAQVGQGEAPEVVTANLEDLMRDSVDAMKPKPAEFTFGFTGFKELEQATFTEKGFVDPPQMRGEISKRLPTIAELEALLERHGTEGVRLKPNGEVEVRPTLGQQEDGTFKMVVTVREGIIEPLRQQAESDRQTPEEWLSERLGDYLDNWWSPATSR